MDPYATNSPHECMDSPQTATITKPLWNEVWTSILNFWFVFFYKDANTLLKHIIDLGRFQQELQWCGEQIFPRPQENLRKSPGKAGGPSISKGLARKKESKPAA